MSKTLIAVYSWSGTTDRLAQIVQEVTGGDYYQIEVPAGTFSQDMYTTSDQAQAQLKAGQLPKLTTALPDLSQYDVVLVGGPVWSGEPATPVRTFLKEAQGSEALFAPFYTHAGSASNYESAFKSIANGLNVVKGFGISGAGVANAKARVATWASQL